MLGLVQSGLPQLRVASLQDPAHRELAVRARSHAESLLDAVGAARPAAARPRRGARDRLAPAGRDRRTGERRMTACLTPAA